jgi:hypothetical protein
MLHALSTAVMKQLINACTRQIMLLAAMQFSAMDRKHATLLQAARQELRLTVLSTTCRKLASATTNLIVIISHLTQLLDLSQPATRQSKNA